MFSLIKKDSSNLVNQDGKDIGLKQLLLVVGLLLSATNFNAHAVLTPYNSNGVDLVYSSVSDITWTKDANLLGTMINTQGYNNVVNAIIAASPSITNTPNYFDGYTGSYDISVADFSTSGRTTWFGAQAFSSYLNSINYAGSNQWVLPTPGANPNIGYNLTGSEFGQLFYNELGGTAHSPIPNTTNFVNEQFSVYWLGTEYASASSAAWGFGTNDGYQTPYIKPGQSYVWAVSPGLVPIPASVWLFGSALFGLLGLKRRGHVG